MRAYFFFLSGTGEVNPNEPPHPARSRPSIGNGFHGLTMECAFGCFI